jgi:hypothetical protein
MTDHFDSHIMALSMEPSQQLDCAICIEPIIIDKQPQMQMPACRHVFHTRCFLRFIQYGLRNQALQITCPECRAKVMTLPAPPPPPLQPAMQSGMHTIMQSPTMQVSQMQASLQSYDDNQSGHYSRDIKLGVVMGLVIMTFLMWLFLPTLLGLE